MRPRAGILCGMSDVDSSRDSLAPTVKWVSVDGRSIAYQCLGTGPPNVLLLDDWYSHLDLDWDDPFRARWIRRVAASACVIRFDKSGMGLSDRIHPPPDTAMDVWADEAIAVLDAAKIGTARLLVSGWSGPLGATLASRHASRFDRIAFTTAFMRLRGSGDPVGVDSSIVDAAAKIVLEQWGNGVLTTILGQDRDRVPDYQHRLDSRYERSSVAPRDLPATVDALLNADATRCLARISAETLVVHRPNPLLPVDHSQYVAENVARGRLELVAEDEWRYPFAEDELLPDWLVALTFLTDSTHERDLQQRLYTIVFIDIVGSTPHIQRVGDREWSASLDDFRAALDLGVAHYGGWLAGSAGDGFFLAFDSPSRAMRFTLAMSAKAEAVSLPIRAGLHTGECHSEGSELRGLAVHAAARIMDKADRGQVVTSSVVRALLSAEPVEFSQHGTHTLRGVPGEWDLFTVRNLVRTDDALR